MNEDVLFEEDVDAIIYTSSIQNEQSIKENIPFIFLQIYTYTVSSVNRDSDVSLFSKFNQIKY